MQVLCRREALKGATWSALLFTYRYVKIIVDNIDNIDNLYGATPFKMKASKSVLCWGYSAVGKGLVSSEKAPSWSLSPFIRHHYRKQMPFRDSLASTFVVHNETGSIWTHLVGLLVFVALLIRDLFFRNLPPHHRLLHAALLLSAQYCMGTSTAYHILLPTSQKTYEMALNCDLSGIAMCIITIFLVGLRYAFWCHEDIGHAYMCVVAIWSIILYVLPQVQSFTRLHKHAVPFLYFGFVVFALVPLIHWAVLVGGIFSVQGKLWFFRTLAAGLTLLAGFFFWATKFPESTRPGRFDLVFQSHQFWHICVFVSICLFYDAMTVYAEFRIHHSCGGVGSREE